MWLIGTAGFLLFVILLFILPSHTYKKYESELSMLMFYSLSIAGLGFFILSMSGTSGYDY